MHALFLLCSCRLLASTSYGASLELWDTSCLDEDADNDEEAAEKPQESQVESTFCDRLCIHP